MGQPHIQAGDVLLRKHLDGFRRGLSVVAQDRGVILPRVRARDGHGFNPANQGTVQHSLDNTHFGQVQGASLHDLDPL
ncbi:MAG: hypothetical protein J4G19_09910, partial [Pseudomonadales bacterium]|nr:hypothetical protein [Pseudomonadales bacterium]